MEVLILIVTLATTGYWFCRAGKRDGSRKGYGGGRFHRRRRKP